MSSDLPALIKPSVPIVKQGTTTAIGIPVQQFPKLIHFQAKQLTINGTVCLIDAEQLMGMIKNITQTIGEYKNMNNPMKHYVIPGLRKIRRDMVNDLEHHFHIHWQINQNTGECIFWM